MAKHINVSMISINLRNTTESISRIVSLFSDVDSNYVQATKSSQWSSVAAGEYMTEVVKGLNQFSSEFNSKFREGFTEFKDRANYLLRNEHASTVDFEMKNIQSINAWQGSDSDFLVPDNYASFTDANFTDKVNGVITHINHIKSFVKNAISSGLDNAFCTKISASLDRLNDSAEEALKVYNKDIVDAAIAKDRQIKKEQEQL